MKTLKSLYKQSVAKLLRPGLAGIEGRLDRIEAKLSPGGAADKQESELAFWRSWVKQGGSEQRLGESFGSSFGRWQRERLEQLGEYIGLAAGTGGGGGGA